MWYYKINDKQSGPLDLRQFKELIENGVITKETFVWTEIMSEWRKAGDIPALTSRYFSPKKKTTEKPNNNISETKQKVIGYIVLAVIIFFFILIMSTSGC